MEPFKKIFSIDQTAKDVPHPQVDDALGLLNTNPRASRPVPQSISIPCKYNEWAGLMMQGIPPISTHSFSGLGSSKAIT